MSDQEFRNEIRRAAIILMRACIKKYGMGWADFMPKDEVYVLPMKAANQTLSASVEIVGVDLRD